MTRILAVLAIFLGCSCFFYVKAAPFIPSDPDTVFLSDTIHIPDSLEKRVISSMQISDTIRKDSIDHKKYRNKKLIAAILSFPLPFGFIGLHRVFLGTKPYMPFVYIGTLGGCFFILPLIDFVAILSSNEESFKALENNPRVFMWSH